MRHTPRTATAKWKNLRRRTLQEAKRAGQTNCPICGAWIDWQRSQTPTSPEPDHIIPSARGGTDHPSNLRIICRQCNQRLGGQLGAARRSHKRRKHRPPAAGPLPTSQAW